MAPFKLTEVSKTNKSSITESFNDRCLCNTFGADGRLDEMSENTNFKNNKRNETM